MRFVSQPPGTTAQSAAQRVPSAPVEHDQSFDLAAAGLRSDGTDLAVSFEVLATKLEQALPGRARAERRGGGLLGRGPRATRAVQVELGDHRYRLEMRGGRLHGSRERRSGGIVIKREELEPPVWVVSLTEALREEAQHDSEARVALERLLA